MGILSYGEGAQQNFALTTTYVLEMILNRSHEPSDHF